MVLPKQFFVQFLTLTNIWFSSSLYSQTTKSMKTNAQQNIAMTVNDTTNSLEINLTIRSFLEKWLKAQWISFSGSLIYRNMILFFQSWNIFFSSIFDTDNIIHYLEYVLTHHWTCTYFNLYFISIFSLVISEGSKSFDETELFINSSAELKKCNGHLWGVS